MDFSEEMRFNDNDKVNTLCRCTGCTMTISRRIQRDAHQKWCPYREFVEKRIEELLKTACLSEPRMKELRKFLGLD